MCLDVHLSVGLHPSGDVSIMLQFLQVHVDISSCPGTAGNPQMVSHILCGHVSQTCVLSHEILPTLALEAA